LSTLPFVFFPLCPKKFTSFDYLNGTETVPKTERKCCASLPSAEQL
jgi:hypothetical protein